MAELFGLSKKRLEYGVNKFRGFAAFHRQKTVVSSNPVIHGIEVTNLCQLKCRMCNRHERRRRGYGMMSLQQFKKIVDENSDCFKALALFFHGEPLLNPNVENMIRYVKPYASNLSLTSNGMLLDEKRAKNLLLSGLDQLCVSFDAPNKEVYEYVRVNADFDVVKQNILTLLKLRQKLEAKTRIYLAYVLMDKTRPHVEDFRSYWMSKGVDAIRFIPMHGWGGYGQKNNKHLGDTRGLYRSNSVCSAAWVGFHVFYNGDVAPCCIWTGTPEDERLGNLFENTAREIWNGPNYQDFRYRLIHDQGSLNRCANCRVEPYTNLSIDRCEAFFPFSRSFLSEFVVEPFLRRVRATRAPKLTGRDG